LFDQLSTASSDRIGRKADLGAPLKKSQDEGGGSSGVLLARFRGRAEEDLRLLLDKRQLFFLETLLGRKILLW
jgi:hypothetical protein